MRAGWKRGSGRSRRTRKSPTTSRPSFAPIAASRVHSSTARKRGLTQASCRDWGKARSDLTCAPVLHQYRPRRGIVLLQAARAEGNTTGAGGWRSATAADLLERSEAVLRVKERFGTLASAQIVSLHDGGRDGIWLQHRRLRSTRIDYQVVDSASIKISGTNRPEIVSATWHPRRA